MKARASAPGKAILFGEHAVVYGKPAIAIAINKRAYINVSKRDDDKIRVNVRDLGISGYLDVVNGKIQSKNNRIGILEYPLKVMEKIHDGSGLDVTIDVNIPIGAGLGSSSAVTVATILAVSKFNDMDLSKEQIAKYAYEVESDVQNAASPIDTTLSTYGGVIYLSENAEKIVPLEINWDIPLVIGSTEKRGNTGKLIEWVRLRKETYPEIMDNLIDSIGVVTKIARKYILERDDNKIGELMNINHGLLDAIGVNTKELSDMVYLARNAGALGSKITGAGGGGSIIAYCPSKIDQVFSALDAVENAFKAKISKKGVDLTN